MKQNKTISNMKRSIIDDLKLKIENKDIDSHFNTLDYLEKVWSQIGYYPKLSKDILNSDKVAHFTNHLGRIIAKGTALSMQEACLVATFNFVKQLHWTGKIFSLEKRTD